MGLRINKNFKFSPSIDEILFFESDEEFTDFCVAPYAEIKKSENGSAYFVGDYSDEYKKCIEQGKKFIIKDEDSQVFKRQCVTRRVPVFNNGVRVTTREDYPVQLLVKNLEEYDKWLWEKGRIKKLREELEASPMYNMSLSSKELFHSNLFAWLGNNHETRYFFTEIIYKLTGIKLNCNENWTVEREDKNFDLCIKEDKDYILVIENKVKSIPRKSQLDEYARKIKTYYKGKEYHTKYLLLTLATSFPHKTDIKKEDIWEIKTYKDLSDAMDKNLNLLTKEYYQQLLDDYVRVIKNLNAIVEVWQNGIYFAYTDDLGGLNKLSDLHAKIQFSSYCVELKELIVKKFHNIVVLDNNDKIGFNEIDENKLYLMVDWGFASHGKVGVLDISIPVTNHEEPRVQYGCCDYRHVVKIQVEGRSYRHVIESMKDSQKLVSLGKGNPYKKLEWFSQEPSKNSNKVNYGDKEIFYAGLYPNSVVSLRNKNSWPFKSYQNKKGEISFIYQSKNIKEEVDVTTVLSNIVNEVDRVLETFK